MVANLLDDFFALTLCILIDFPIHIDKISMGLTIVYLKGSQVEFSKLWCIYVPDGSFIFRKQYPFRCFQNTKG